MALQFPHWLGVHKYNPYLSVSETVVDDQNANRHHGTESPLIYPHSNSSSPLWGTGLHESPWDRVGDPHGPKRRQKLYEKYIGHQMVRWSYTTQLWWNTSLTVTTTVSIGLRVGQPAEVDIFPYTTLLRYSTHTTNKRTVQKQVLLTRECPQPQRVYAPMECQLLQKPH